MNQTEAAERINKIKQQILQANQAYFMEDKEIIPESIRDQLKQELIQLETQFPELLTPDSPTQKVGAPLGEKLPKIEHKNAKFSLQDAFTDEDLTDFDERLKRFLKVDEVEYSCELKIDGLNITLWYENGLLEKAITRGDGKVGEDVTHTIRTIQNLPLKLPQPINLEVSGEVFINRADFEIINQKETNPSPLLPLPEGEGNSKESHFIQPEILKRAKDLRKRQTSAEAFFWEIVRNRQLNNLKFRRQHPIGGFITDFCCTEHKLIIEFDGFQHQLFENKKYDKTRDSELSEMGFKVLRFTNHEILENTKKTLETILKALPSSSGRGAGGEGIKAFKNPRNLAAGTVRQLDPEMAAQRNLQINLYDLKIHPSTSGRRARGEGPENQTQLFQTLKQLKLPHEPTFFVFSNIQEVIQFCKNVTKAKQTFEKEKREASVEGGSKEETFSFPLKFDIDGIVIKAHSIPYRKRLGYTAKTAKYAIAYKFPAEIKYTKLLDIDFQIGRTGAITPVAILEPVEIAGSTVQKASLHNAEEMERKNIKINDTVMVHKAGDIIPEILEPILSMRTGQELEISFPTHCPSCQSPLNTCETIYRCENNSCPAKQSEKLIYFAKTLDIEGLGASTVESLLNENLISTPADFWKLSPSDLSQIPLFKEKRIENLLKAIKDKKKLELGLLLTALGIRLVGKENAQLISQFLNEKFGPITLQNFIELLLSESQEENWQEELNNVDGLGQKVIESFTQFIHNERNINHLKALLNVGINILWKKEKKEQQIYSSINFVITGSFQTLSRDEIKQTLSKKGGKVQSAISRNTHILIAGEKAGSKLKKAQEFKTEIWDENRLMNELEVEKQTQDSLF